MKKTRAAEAMTAELLRGTYPSAGRGGGVGRGLLPSSKPEIQPFFNMAVTESDFHPKVR